MDFGGDGTVPLSSETLIEKFCPVGPQRDAHGVAFAERSRMLNGVGDQFIHDERERPPRRWR